MSNGIPIHVEVEGNSIDIIFRNSCLVARGLQGRRGATPHDGPCLMFSGLIVYKITVEYRFMKH